MAQKILRHLYVSCVMKNGFFYSFNLEVTGLRGFLAGLSVTAHVYTFGQRR